MYIIVMFLNCYYLLINSSILYNTNHVNPNGIEEKIDLFLGLQIVNYFYILVVLENVYKKKCYPHGLHFHNFSLLQDFIGGSYQHPCFMPYPCRLAQYTPYQ